MITLTRIRARLLPLALLAAIAVVAACGGSDATPTPTPQPGPITFPYVLSGSFTVGGQPGPAGSKIFTMINGKQSGLVAQAPSDGHYNNVIAGANSTDDYGQEVTIYLGDPEGDSVQAEERFIFHPPGSIQTMSLDLTFPSLP